MSFELTMPLLDNMLFKLKPVLYYVYVASSTFYFDKLQQATYNGKDITEQSGFESNNCSSCCWLDPNLMNLSKKSAY